MLDFAGAGAQGLTWLHSVGGSSRTILEATDRYSQRSLTGAIGFEPARFTSQGVAQALAVQAYERAQQLASADEPVAGVGCTATIATDRTKKGDHRCFVAAYNGSILQFYNLTMTKGERDRAGEEALVGKLLLNAVAQSCGLSDTLDLGLVEIDTFEAQTISLEPFQQLLAGTRQFVLISSTGLLDTCETPPPNPLLVSGSFNPLHDGHRQMAEIAAYQRGQTVFYELPFINADKAPIDLTEALRRSAQFLDLAPLLLTRTPLFSQKAELFPGATFVLGADTAARLVQPRFYNDDPAEMRVAFDVIRAQGCGFLVAGRVQTNGRFKTMADIEVPEGYAGLFEQIPEDVFRLDVSSSQIRSKLS